MSGSVPRALKRWFIVHFAVDLFVAVPLFVAPSEVLSLFGWTEVDPAMSRVVAAALFGIGIQSLLGRDEDARTYRAMLNLKVIWSTAAVVGIAVSLLQGAPRMAWLFLAIFVLFSAAWWYFRLTFGRRGEASAR